MILNQEFLSHHGIMGQKWGIRRFQDKYGRLTPEGKLRYSKNSEKKDDTSSEETNIFDDGDIKKLKELPAGEERNKVANKVLKNMSEFRTKVHAEADEAYNKGGRGAWNAVLSKYDNTEDGKMYNEHVSWLMDEITTKSGDWYHGEGISKEFKKNREELKKTQDKYREREKELGIDERGGSIFQISRREKIRKADKVLKELEEKGQNLNDDLIGVVLRDLNFPDTPENRGYIYPYVIWD